MRNWLFATFLGLCLVVPVRGQEEAAMASPVLRATPEAINITARFSNFPSGSQYRLGVGAVGEGIGDVELELLKGDAPVSKESVSFKQGYAQSWFEVDEIAVRGYTLASSDHPAQGQDLVLKITLPRAEAERVKKVFVILAKYYNPDRWYILEGAELTDTLW